MEKMYYTLPEDNFEARKKEICDEYNEIMDSLENFDVEKSSLKDLESILLHAGKISMEIEDVLNDLEVEHFLTFGPGINNPNI